MYSTSSLGAYYADSPGYDMPNEAAAGFGAIDFSADQTWAEIEQFNFWQKTHYSGETSPPADVNAATRRAANRIRAALAQLGFGPNVQMDSYWGSGTDCAAYTLFLNTMGLAKTPGPCGGVSKPQLLVLEDLVRKQRETGETPGPLEIVEYHEVSPGTYVKGPAPGQAPLKGKLSGAGGWGMLLVVAGIAGGVYLLTRKKSLFVKKTTTYTSNRRHRRRRFYRL